MHSSDAKEEVVRRILELRVEHRDLDDAINALSQADYVDQLQLKRLKKRKLNIKDTILRLESGLIPDVDAQTFNEQSFLRRQSFFPDL